MKRSITKTLSVLLAVIMVFAVFAALPLSANAQVLAVTLNATSNFFEGSTTYITTDGLEASDNFVTVAYNMRSDKNLLSTDWTLTYDATVLEYSDAYNTIGEGQDAYLNIMPYAPGAMINTNPASAPNSIIGNCTDLTLYPLTLLNGEAVPFVVVTFKVIGTGDANVDLHVNDLSIARPLNDGEYSSNAQDEVQVVFNGVADPQYADQYTVSSETYYGEYDDPGDNAPLTVKGTSNFFPSTTLPCYQFTDLERDADGNAYVVVEFSMTCNDSYLVNLDIDEITWDPNVLEWKEEYNTYGDGQDSVLNLFPFAAENGYGSGIIHHTDEGRLVGNYSGVSPAAYAYGEAGEEITVIRLVFKVLNENAGDTYVRCNVETLAICDETEQAPYAQTYLVQDKDVADNADEIALTGSTVYILEPELIIGDVNKDGVVTIDDATVIQRFLAEYLDDNDMPLIDVTDEVAFTVADTNRDGKISIRDVTEIQRFIAEIIDEF